MKVSMPTQMILHDRTSLALVCDSQTCADCVVPFRFLAHASDSPPHPTYHAPCSSHFQLQVALYGTVPNNGTSKPPAVGSSTTAWRTIWLGQQHHHAHQRRYRVYWSSGISAAGRKVGMSTAIFL